MMVNFIMYYESYYEDTNNESRDFSLKNADPSNVKQWKYIIKCNNARKLIKPLDIRKLPNLYKKAYENTQTIGYVEEQIDVEYIKAHFINYL